MTIYIVRASHANEYELQNYAPIAPDMDIKIITSNNPLTKLSLPTIPLWSPTDLPRFPLRRQLLNRLIGGEQWLAGLDKIVKRVDILHTAETYTPYTHQAVELRRQGRIKKLICTCWETIPGSNEKIGILKKWKSEAYQYVDLFHTPTERGKQALIKEGVKISKIKVIPYGVDLSRFKSSKRPASQKPVILTVARPIKEKGIDIYHQLKKELGNHAHFRWVTGLDYSQMPTIYQEADIFLLPSQVTKTWEEQYGMVLVEAMAAGLPIVTTKSGAIPEVVGDAALTANPTDTMQITAHLKRLISDPKLRERYAGLSQSYAKEHYDHTLVAKQLATLYT